MTRNRQTRKQRTKREQQKTIHGLLGCVFAPDDCVLEKRKQEKKMDR